jgi:hypothetical protein
MRLVKLCLLHSVKSFLLNFSFPEDLRDLNFRFKCKCLLEPDLVHVCYNPEAHTDEGVHVVGIFYQR